MTTTMCVKRAGLVWALLLLTTTCFMLTCAAPRGIEDHFGGPKGRNGIANGNPTEEHPTVSTTPPITSTDGVDSSQKTTEEAPVTPAISSDPNSDHDAEEYLYYEIKKRIFFERNLNFSDIKYVLSQKDKDRFMYALTDKLGYMSEGRKPNDPHLPVIRSHRDKLIELLEKMAAKKEPKPPVSQGGPSDETSASKEPPSPSYINKIGYEVSADIRDLGPDAIQDILSELTFPDALGYAVGIKLGYSQGDKHMKYLQNANADELKEVLQQTLQLKTTRKTLLDDSFDSSRSEPTPIPPTTKPASKEPPSPSDINKIAFEVSIDIHDLSPDAIRRILSELTFSDALGYAVGSNLGYSQGDEHMKFLEHADADKLKIILQRTLESKTTSKTIPDDSFDSSRSEPTPIPPTTKPANKEPPSPSDINKIAFEVSVDIRDRLGPDAIRRILSELTFSDALGYAVGIKLGYSQGDEHMKFLERADADELKIILQRTLESKTTSKTIPNEPKQPNEPTDLQSTKAPSANTKLDKSKPGDGDGAWPADYANRVGSVLTDTSAPDDGGLELILKIDESERVNLLNSKGFQNYLSKIHSKLYQQFMMEEADPNEIDLALEEYLEWPSQGSDFMEDERGGGDEPEAEEDYSRSQAVQRYWNADYGHVQQVVTPAAPPDDFLLLYQIDSDIRGYSYQDVNDLLSYEDDTLPYALAEKLGQSHSTSIRVIKENLKKIKGYLEREKEKKQQPSIDYNIIPWSMIVLLLIVQTLAMLYYCVLKTKVSYYLQGPS